MDREIRLTIEGKEYVAIPVEEYRKFRRGKVSAQVDGIAWAHATLGENLRKAREAAGLTQGELAERLGKSQAMISRAESGDMQVSERYVGQVLKACGLPKTWKAGR